MIRRRNPWQALALVAAGMVWLSSLGPAQENLGTSQQPLVGGTQVAASTQEQFGLLSLATPTGGCSASLLRNNWAITAAHCLEVKDAMGNRVPDPARPEQFLVNAPNTVTLTATWGGGQTLSGVQIATFRPFDVAIIRLASPFKVNGSTSGYSRLIFQDGQFPYWGTEVGAAITVFGRGINQFASGSGDTAIPSRGDGLYRMGYARPNREEANLYWYPSDRTQSVAGGDSGGPSFAWTLGGYALVGVHALTTTECAPGKACGDWRGPGPAPAGYNPWQWVARTPQAADAPIDAVLDRIITIMGPAPPSTPSLTPPPPGFIGKFSTTPKNYQPMWVYGITPNGYMMWHRKDTGTSPWQGPKVAGTEWTTFKTVLIGNAPIRLPVAGIPWTTFKNVIAAGGNSFYALTPDNQLVWYQHSGFNDGAPDWKPGVTVGRGWGFSRIFSGGDGIVYAVRPDGTLIWYRHDGYLTGGGPNTWSGGGAPKIIGNGWGSFKELFSTGQGSIYGVKPDGAMVLYKHLGYATGAKSWGVERVVGAGWHTFRQVIPVGDGVMLALREDGKLHWYKHFGRVPSGGTSALARVRLVDKWEGPVEIGSGWQGYGKLVAILPVTNAPIVR